MCLLRRRRRGVRLDTRNVKPFEKRSPLLLRLSPSVRPPDRRPRPRACPTEENPNRGFRHSNQKRPPLIGDWIKLRNGSRKTGSEGRNSGLGPVLGWGRREVVLNLETEQFGQITDTGISLMSQSEEPSDSALTDRRNERERTDGRSSGSFKPLSVRPFGHFIPSTVGRTATHRRRLLLQLQQRGRGVRRPH